MVAPSDFRLTWLWRHAFVNPLPDVTVVEQEYFRDRFLSMRDKAAVLVSQISSAIPGLTVHDITHLDALWETASLVSEGAITVSPAEAFVFGASILLHDSAMSLAAYPGGLDQLKQTVAWKDTVTTLLGDSEHGPDTVEQPPKEIIERAVPEVLRQLHAQQAEALAKQGWPSANGDIVYLIDDSELRFFYGETIGQIAHSHWWSVSRVGQDLAENLGAFPSRTKSQIDRVKLACLLRIADALHLDQRRAPRFMRALTNPRGFSALHWTFQERLAVPHIEHEAVVFTAGAPFTIADADAWWLAYDTISAVNRELQDVDLLMQNRGKGLFFRARRVKGAGSPESLSRTIQTRGWRPIDTQLRVSDIPKVVETLGGAKLYGDDPTVVLRELIQNSADAIQARRCYQQGRREDWGSIKVSLTEDSVGHWLSVEDNGVGMSEVILTGPLIDFGTSFWSSSLVTQEFPGLVSKGMNAIGRYGIGFFSVFMIGKVVRVVSRRLDQSEDSARVLEFRDGTASRPILSPAERGQAPIDGGTRIEILLKNNPRNEGGLLYVNKNGTKNLSLKQLVASLAPSLSVSIDVEEAGVAVEAVRSGDWLNLTDDELLARLSPLGRPENGKDRRLRAQSTIRPMFDNENKPVGRAYIRPDSFFTVDGGWVTIGGLRASRLSNIQGVLLGETITADRNSALPKVSEENLALWATEQALIVCQSKSDELIKAKCAEVVLECGGDVGELPIACWGQDDWLTSSELRKQISDIEELVINFDGEFSYDEDLDDVHPKQFRSGFEIEYDVMTVPKHNGSILSIGQKHWPKSGEGRSYWKSSNLANKVRSIVNEVWGEDTDEYSESRKVGTVEGESITREVTIFARVWPDPEE
ncbi:ATP-binding protein [Pseudomonas sp. SZMC_28357]|uniref:HD domain-containing protein n=1 Tax=Pseudomonas sp. SZMC_28357 TaxID=3074380 RepID=UPI0028727FA5|nr:ATP-binding protein [Pseudomonas sp. SZMC_28357]MDR9754458.1 ATP-binding protein [Pseudomonas sp. SZMC_28357]